MAKRVFWTERRLEAISKTSLTIFQAFLIAGVVGGVWGKIPAGRVKVLFVTATVMFFCIGIIFADWPIRRER